MIYVVIQKHGGQAHGSGQLPPMEERDENGDLWAAAAEPPSSYLDELDEETEAVEHGSPASTIHLGAPPPPPPPQPHGTPTPAAETTTAAAERTGELTPPMTLTDSGLSPIER